MTSIKKMTRAAGLYYLLVILFGGFAQFFVRVQLIVPNDAHTTVQNILSHETLFRYGFLADIIQLIIFSLLLLVLYQLLNPINPSYARAMFTLASLGVPIAAINMLHQYAVLFLIEDDSFICSIREDERYALSLFFLELHNVGYAIAHIFFGLWLYPLGHLIYRSGLLPKFIGVFLMLAPLGYIFHMIAGFVLPDYQRYTEIGALCSGIAEMLFMIALFRLGFKKPSKQVEISS